MSDDRDPSAGRGPDTAALLDALPCAAALFDDALRMTAANATFRAMSGVTDGAPLTDAFPMARTDLAGAIAGAAKGRVEIVRGVVFGDDDAARHADVTFAPLAASDGRTAILVTALDVTEIVALRRQVAGRRADELRLEQHVEARTREFLALQERRANERRLAAVGQLAAGVMHDVNNALNPIMAAAFLLEANAENPAAVRDYAMRIAKAAETGAATASRVGRFIRQEPTPDAAGAVVDLSELAEEIVALTRPRWGERPGGGEIRFSSALAPQVLVRGLAGELREALLNLVQNALDAMPEGGQLVVRTAIEGNEAIVEVADSGIGMTREVLERAFEPFFTTKGAGGSGLGLAEVYGIARRHRGRAEIESTLGAGTTVRLRLPSADADDVPGPEDSVGREPRHVLVVEDHEEGREFLRTVLEMDGHRVVAVDTLAAALALVEADDAAPFDVVVTDIGLPDGSGWELVARARARRPELLIGVVTGWEPWMPAGAEHDFAMRKPVRPAELLARVGGGVPRSAGDASRGSAG